MHLFLTDRLACPRCGPEFGLILLAHRVQDQRILEGELGCPNCRQTYPVTGGFGDLRPPPHRPLPPVPETGEAADARETLEVAALLGVAEGPGTLLLRGSVAKHGEPLARLIPGVEVVADDPAVRERPEGRGVSRLVSRGRLPFFDGTFRGVCLGGEREDEDVEEAVRVLAPLGRVVVMEAGEETGERLRTLGLELLLVEGGVVVARLSRPAPPPLNTLRVP